jgi:hypothetical protein
MSKTFGDMRQLALVVSDIDLAMQYWARIMGVDPFFIKRNILFSHYHYQGQPMSNGIMTQFISARRNNMNTIDGMENNESH